MDKLRVGIIGCGGIATLKHFPALSKQVKKERIELVAFCDIVEERATAACAQFGSKGAKSYKHHAELLKDKSIDVVYVLTPNNTHCELTVDSLEAGKNVLCEKPMAATSSDAKKMLDAAKRTGKKLTIGYQNRFRRDTKILYDACRAGQLGDIYYAKAFALRRKMVPTWGVFGDKTKQGGGPLIDIGTHALDIALWTMGNYKPKVVLGSVFKKLSDNCEGNLFGPWNPKTWEVEDSAFGFIKMEDGATISLETSWALNMQTQREGQVLLCGTKAGAEQVGDGASAPTSPVNGAGRVLFNSPANGELYDHVPWRPGGASPADFGGDVYRVGDAEADSWLGAVINDTEPLVKPEQAFVVTQILEAIYKSAESGKAVELSAEKAVSA